MESNSDQLVAIEAQTAGVLPLVPVTKVVGNEALAVVDSLAIEEPLEIRLSYHNGLHRATKNIAVTMRTPGNDDELATGFLFTEGITTVNTVIETVDHPLVSCGKSQNNMITVSLAANHTPNLPDTERNFYTTSSCGVCGKSSIAAIRTVDGKPALAGNSASVSAACLKALPNQLRSHQHLFSYTGGLHGCALFDLYGNLLIAREDVGRHNALDKLIGKTIADAILPLHNHILLLSGRASFELIQKAVMAGITTVAAIGAPSSLAVQLAEEFDITLVGFLREQSFNIYTGASRIYF